ncbi:Gamma-soluble NSF attachment protein [Armadillidium nasatum]|uniref:Gamma-soluble NSF attachment protein n=1 Tax=Armadillidium nasatum TaxID=96803 RepID=A0A5N5TML6_9CRUS|nr:Gamma-soluble NSF attachment protein [Armadillidium nasatum]
MGSNKKVEEALAHIREAEKSLKTGLLKWKPDYDIAADEYNAAATCYKAARQFAQYRDCLLKAAENYKICRSFFSAAKCVEHAALASKEIGDIDSIASLSERAAGLYRNHGVPDTAALALDKGAKMIEGQNVEKAIHLYKYAVEIVMVQTVNSLIQGFDEQDGDMVLKALNSAFIKHMDVEYAKLAKIIPIPKTSEEQKKSKEESSYSHDANESAQQTSEGKHDDEELDLC